MKNISGYITNHPQIRIYNASDQHKILDSKKYVYGRGLRKMVVSSNKIFQEWIRVKFTVEVLEFVKSSNGHLFNFWRYNGWIEMKNISGFGGNLTFVDIHMTFI